MKWFKHDSDANMDAKLQEILLDYGLEGYGLYWYCLELIVNKVDSDNVSFGLEHDARIIARNTGSTLKRTEEMMKRMVELGLFSNSAGKITCLKLAQRLDKSMVSSPKMRDLIGAMRESHDGVMTESGLIMQDKTREEEKRIDNINNQEKEVNRDKVDAIPYQKIIDLYHQILPWMPNVRLLTAARKRAIGGRWNELKIRQSLEWWEKYFNHINDNQPMLRMDDGSPQKWCDFAFLVNQEKMDVIETGVRYAEKFVSYS